jgi:hypothetical protein
MTGVISLAMLQAMEVDPDPFSIPTCPAPFLRPSAPDRRSVWTLLAHLLRRRG